MESGETIWRRRTNRARNNDVNSTPVIADDLVIVSTNAKTAVAYDAISGKVAWNQTLDAPSVFGPVAHHDSVLAVADSLYVLNPRTGKILRRCSWEGEKVLQADSTPRSVVLMFAPKLSNDRLPVDKAAAEKVAALHPHYETLVFMAKSGKQRTRKILASCAALRYVPATGFVYLSHLRGIDVLRPVTGTLLWQLRLEDGPRGGIALVDVKDNEIYALAGDGSVYALRHPRQIRVAR
jgi:outer membrane protein assembly factor BamB